MIFFLFLFLVNFSMGVFTNATHYNISTWHNPEI